MYFAVWNQNKKWYEKPLAFQESIFLYVKEDICIQSGQKDGNEFGRFSIYLDGCFKRAMCIIINSN